MWGARAPTGGVAWMRRAVVREVGGPTGEWAMQLPGIGNKLKALTTGLDQLSKQAAGLPIAVDFGLRSLKVLQLSKGEPPSLVSAASIETPEDLLFDTGKRLAFQAEALPKLIRQGGFRGKRAVCAIPSSMAVCKHLQIQRADGVPLQTLVESTLPAQLRCDPDDIVFRFVEVAGVERGSGKAEVVAMASPREVVAKLMIALREAKLEPVGIHTEYQAVLAAFEYLNKRLADKLLTNLYVEIGACSTRVLIAHGGDLVFARNIDVGGRLLDEMVAKQLKYTFNQAHEHRMKLSKLTPGDEDTALVGAAVGSTAASGGVAGSTSFKKGDAEDDRRIGVAPAGLSGDVRKGSPLAFQPRDVDLTEPLEILTDEISMSLRYHESLFPSRKIDRAIFIGGESRHTGLVQHIARALRLPAQVADPMARVGRTGKEPSLGVDFGEGQPGWTVPLGLCLAPTDL
ncbi:MAG: pilus assembly protein PilM [Phycisphaerales bacterium]|jgi:type IV pilus assembly protein PilM|nr:pilus assembly protein PilM [Phycisphaerales bacterium]